MKHREGAWNGSVPARCAAKIVRLEHETTAALTGGAFITEASHIPETARLHEAFFEFSIAEMFIDCKTLKLDTDQDWTSRE